MDGLQENILKDRTFLIFKSLFEFIFLIYSYYINPFLLNLNIYKIFYLLHASDYVFEDLISTSGKNN